MSATNPYTPLPHRPLGRTGRQVSLFGLGGEGVLRTFGQEKQAEAVIQRALEQGVTYFDTAPAYSGSMNYLGANLGDRRKDIFLACKSHDRTRDGSFRLMEESFRQLRTDYFDLWQLHDLRTQHDLDVIFGAGGTLEAFQQAREQGLTRHLGITGHHDPAILLEALRRFSFDAALVALNAADVHRLSFLRSVLPEAERQGVAVIGMKVCAQGRLLHPAMLNMAEAMGYVLSLPAVSHVIVGCQTTEEVDENANIVRQFQPLSDDAMRELEERTKEHNHYFGYFKRPDDSPSLFARLAAR